MAKITQTAGRNALGEFAPEFAHFNDDVLFGENWNNQDIDVKTRKVWTVNEGDLPYEDKAMRAHAKEMVFPIGTPNNGFAQYFSGRSFLAPVSTSQVGIFNVTFEPGCRNNWHIHHGARQILICGAGKGWYQEWGKPAIALEAGDVIDIPEGVKHWHGAQKHAWFQHIATHVAVENSQPGSAPNEWLEPVTDEEYNKLPE